MKQITSEMLFEKLKNIKVSNPLCTYTRERCESLVPSINEIIRYKKQKNALILAHSYVSPDIVYGVADFVGDSYALAKIAKESKHNTIIFPSVRFMAETAKILNPTKTVIDPNPNGGCSLAHSISAEDVLKLREQYPDYTFMCYINTTVDVKALCDVCVTSSNANLIAARIPNDKIYFLPDRLMGENIKNGLRQQGIDKDFKFYHGSCYVHEEFKEESIFQLKKEFPKVHIVAHPECSPSVVQHANAVCSSNGMLDHVKNKKTKDPLLVLTECGITTRLQVEKPNINIIGACTLCKYMRSNSLEAILKALKDPTPSQIIQIPENVRLNALKSLDAMFIYTEKGSHCGKEI